MLLNCVVGEDSWESLGWKEIQPVHPKGNQSWIFTGRTGAESKAPILWPPEEKNWLIGKDLDAGKDWRQVEKWTTVDEMVGLHHQLDGHEFEQVLGVHDGDRSLSCCSSWGHKEPNMTARLSWTDNNSSQLCLGFLHQGKTVLSILLLISKICFSYFLLSFLPSPLSTAKPSFSQTPDPVASLFLTSAEALANRAALIFYLYYFHSIIVNTLSPTQAPALPKLHQSSPTENNEAKIWLLHIHATTAYKQIPMFI